jgi:kumamolisin
MHPASLLDVTVVLHPLRSDAHAIHGVHRGAARVSAERGILERGAEFSRRYDPGNARVALMKEFAARYNLRVVALSRARHDIVLRGRISSLNRAFGVQLRHETRQGRRVHAYTDSITLPHNVADIVDGVIGLDSLPLNTARVLASRRATEISPTDLAAHYAIPSGGGRGKRIALLQFGGGFHRADITAFAARHRLTAPPITSWSVAGGGRNRGCNRPLPRAEMQTLARAWAGRAQWPALFSRFGDRVGAFIESLEVTMDVQLALAFGGGAAIDVVFAPSGADGWRRALYAMIGHAYPSATYPTAIPLPTVLSISWGESEQTFGAMKLRLINNALSAVVRSGVTICAASGDQGTANEIGVCADMRVNFPASSPVVVSVGGTQLTSTGGGHTELAWSGTLKGGAVATGGGMSGFFAMPRYQRSLARPAVPALAWRAPGVASAVEGRWVPDIAANAGFGCAVTIVVGSTPLSAGGTSAATPLVAALLTRAGRSQRALHQWLYSRSARHACRDIVAGNNDTGRKGLPYFRARAGWDACTGFGTLLGTESLRQLAVRAPRRKRLPTHDS